MELQVMCSSIELLQVMLEETNEKISELAQGISNDLGVFILLQAMLQLEVNIDASLSTLNYIYIIAIIIAKIIDYYIYACA